MTKRDLETVAVTKRVLRRRAGGRFVGNTFVSWNKQQNRAEVLLHGNLIFWISPDGHWYATFAGWRTQTARRRLEALMRGFIDPDIKLSIAGDRTIVLYKGREVPFTSFVKNYGRANIELDEESEG